MEIKPRIKGVNHRRVTGKHLNKYGGLRKWRTLIVEFTGWRLKGGPNKEGGFDETQGSVCILGRYIIYQHHIPYISVTGVVTVGEEIRQTLGD